MKFFSVWWPALLGGALILGLMTLTVYAYMLERDALHEWQAEQDRWDQQEKACLEDPSCDLDRFDRRRLLENDDPRPQPGYVLVPFLVLSLIVVVVFAALPDWGNRLDRWNA